MREQPAVRRASAGEARPLAPWRPRLRGSARPPTASHSCTGIRVYRLAHCALASQPRCFEGCTVIADLNNTNTCELGVQLSEKRISDLETLAQYRMLGSGHFRRTGRTPTMVLSTRLSRNDTMR